MKVIEQIVRITTDGDETRAEVVGEITRCAECKFYMGDLDNQSLCEHNTDSVCRYWESDGLYPDDFCSMGERKESNNE